MVSFKSIILAAFVAAPLVAAECTSFQAALAFDQGSGLDPARHEESSWDISQGSKNLCSVVMAKTSNGKQDCNDPGSSVEWQFEGEQSKGSATYCPGNGACVTASFGPTDWTCRTGCVACDKPKKADCICNACSGFKQVC